MRHAVASQLHVVWLHMTKFLVVVGEVLVGKGKHNKLTIEEWNAIHEYIITNSTTIKVAYM